ELQVSAFLEPGLNGEPEPEVIMASFPHIQLQKSGVGLRSPGDSIKFSCKDFDTDYFTISYMNWKLMKIQDRATLNEDTVSNTVYTELRNLTSEDSAIY
ncbi:hypothetical protein A6R68_22157, partial [Neotoma lepida]